MNQTLFDLAEHTNRSIFLTGKAGTGKTTFLNDFVKKTRKKHIILAPTGIAAINAGGVTIHSMFGLPLRPFLPTNDRVDTHLGNNISDLHQHFKYRKDKLKLLREVELIIIDEVSMLRADVLDMMDHSLRFIRRNPVRFGGVQMLFIGDLYQLPPVVRDEEILKKYYRSPFFFDSQALQEVPLITVELTKVYRQTDQHFLGILNAIRDGNIDEVDFDSLNERYNPNFEPAEEAYVYLTSHNRMADAINREKLNALKTESYQYKANVIGDFKENQFPNEEVLELKIGAQVMFIRNDASSEKKYYNGKLAEITDLDEENVYVRIEGREEDYKLKKEIWEQKKYSLGAEKNIEEEVLGSFEQFPIRLAWAVTIHKSQGLTFDRLIIDAGQSFASGQVYVALSRCRTLEGIVLKSRITPDVIFSDTRVENFQISTNANERLDEILHAEKYDYAIKKVIARVTSGWINEALMGWHQSAKSSRFLGDVKVKELYTALNAEAANLEKISHKFSRILQQMAKAFTGGEIEWKEVETKASGAVKFFFVNVHQKIFVPLKDFYAETKGVKGLKQYNEILKTLLDDLEDWLNDLQAVQLLEQPLFDKKNSVEVSSKAAKVPTHILTYKMFEDGKSVSEIARDRGLVNETVYGHLAKFAAQGVLDISRVIAKEKIAVFKGLFISENAPESLNDWKTRLPNEFEYYEIRILLNHFTYQMEHSK